MLKLSVIGAGAAGNKALANLIKSGYPEEMCYFINSTTQDIPEEANRVSIFGQNQGRLGGCGKERSIGKKMLLDDLRSNSIDIDSMVDPSSNAVIIVGSCEGGSGSASIPIFAKYLKDVRGLPVIVCLLFGFHDDVRGIQNTIEIVQELSEEYTVIGIDNTRFLGSSNNRFKAEQAANEKFKEIVKLLMGGNIIPGGQIIDDTDLYKLISTPGYMVCDSIKLPDRIKTMDEFNSIIYNAINDHKFIDPPKEAGAKRIGVIFNVNSIEDSINYNAPQLAELYGTPYEFYISLGMSNTNEFHYIVSGMKFPIDEINSLYNEYLERSKTVNKEQDKFFSFASQLRGDIKDSQFDMLTKPVTASSKKNFFADFGIKDFISGDKIVDTGVIEEKDSSDY